jgi:DNA polymerase III epsilon subunit-like protein
MSALMIVYDTETTGLTLHPDADIRKQPRIIEFGAVLLRLDDGSIEEEVEIMVDPRESLSEEITKITGITDADLVGAPSFEEVLPQLRRLFGSAAAVAAHNLPFDKAMILAELARAGVTDFPWPARELCTVATYKESWGRNPKLIELYAAILGKPLAQTHRALDDVKALVEIIRAERLWELVL